ncbi:MAG: hypothetical protein HQM10_07965 [Candidatus Riflebacteria bacterium]|nr:hypothetical protein [Candidatus Riflebacteria bacterium]
MIKIINKVCSLTILAFYLFQLSSACIAEEKPVQIFFGPDDERAFGLDDKFIRFVNQTKETLDMAFYEFRLDNIIDSLIKAKQRGVKIRIVVDNDNYYYDPNRYIKGKSPHTDEPEPETVGTGLASGALNPFVKRLVDAGIEVKDDNGRASLMHNKFAISDSARVWTGSYNLTDTCSYKNPNSAVILASVDLAKTFSEEFEEMFDKRSFGINSPKNRTAQVSKIGDDKIEVFFAPEDNPNGRIAEILTNAKSEILFMQFAFTADDLGDILIKKHQSGVKVQGVFDRILYRSTGPFGEFSKLTEAEVPALIYSGEGKFHHKIFIVDPMGENPIVVLGSQNASSNGNRNNDENIVILYSKEAALAYRNQFFRFFSKTTFASAHLNYSDFPFASTVLEEAEMIVFGNGKSIRDLHFEFPARWKTDGTSIGEISIIRCGKDTTASEKVELNQKGFFLRNAAIQGFGPKSWLVIRFKNLKLPELAGKYSLLCSALPAGTAKKFLPFEYHPTISILDPASDESFQELLKFIRRVNTTLVGMESRLPEYEIVSRREKLLGLNLKLNAILCEAAKNGNYRRIEEAIVFVESFGKANLNYSSDITGGFSEIKSILKYKIAHATPDSETDSKKAQELLDRIEKLAEKASQR